MGTFNVREMAERIRKNRQEGFYGRRYWYNTANDGRCVIGVFKGLGFDPWFVGYVRENGARCTVRSTRLPPWPVPDVLQQKLDKWAFERNLEEVK